MIDVCRQLATAIVPGLTTAIDDARLPFGVLGEYDHISRAVRLDLDRITADRPDDQAGAVLAVTVHELGHATAPHGELCLLHLTTVPDTIGIGHGAAFVRRCCHLYTRACIAGFRPSCDYVHSVLPTIAFSRYMTLPGVIRETHECRDLSLCDIDRLPLPCDLLESYTDDVARHTHIFETMRPT